MELRLKQLEKTKAYRDSLSGLKDNVTAPRKRVIIAPSMASVDERDGMHARFPTVTTQRALGREKQITDVVCLNGK